MSEVVDLLYACPGGRSGGGHVLSFASTELYVGV